MMLKVINGVSSYGDTNRKKYSDVGICSSPFLVKRGVIDTQNALLNDLLSYAEKRDMRVMADIDDQALLWLKEIIVVYQCFSEKLSVSIKLEESLEFRYLFKSLLSNCASLNPKFLAFYRDSWIRFLTIALRDSSVVEEGLLP